MSAPAIRAWNNVTRQQLEEALLRLHPDDRPSYDATVAVGLSVAILTNGKKGYCDSTTRQIYDCLKGAYGDSVIRNALWALRVAGVIAQVRGGTIGKDGKGRGAHRVFIGADTNDLIPNDYVAPPPRRNPPTGHDLSQTHAESNTGRDAIPTGSDESPTGHDLSTPKDSISSSTAALAGRSTTEDSLGQVDAQLSEMPPRCETCATSASDDDAITKLTRAVMCDAELIQGTSPSRRNTMKEDAASFARILHKHYPTQPIADVVTVLNDAMRERRAGKLIGPARHDDLLKIATQRLD